MSARVQLTGLLVATIVASCAPKDDVSPPAGRDFDAWLASFRQHAIAQGVARDVVARALATVE